MIRTQRRVNPARWLALFCAGFLLAVPLRVCAKPQMNYRVGLSGDLWGNPFSSNFQFDDALRLSGMNMNLSGALFQAEAGDVAANWDQLGLAGGNFQGMKVGIPVGKFDLALLGGTVILQPDILERQSEDLLAPEPASITSRIYGVRAARPLGNRFNLSASHLLTPDAPLSQGKSISTLAVEYKPSTHRRLAFEMAHSSQGNGWQLSGERAGKRLRVQASYRQADLGFSTAGNPSLRTQRDGGLLNMQYRLARPLTLNASTQRYTDRRGGHTNYDSLTLRFAKPGQPALSLFRRSADIEYAPDSSAAGRGTAAHTTGFSIDHTLDVNRLAFQYDRLQFQVSGLSPSSLSPSSLSLSSQVSDRFSLRLARPLSRQTQLAISQSVDMGKAAQEGTSRSLYTTFDVRHRVGKSGLRVDLGFQYANRLAQDRSGQAISLRTGFNYRLSSGSTLGLQYRTRLTGSGSMSMIPMDRVYLSYGHRFGGGSKSGNRSVRERRQLGKILGRVFEDKNTNGKLDEGEPGIADVTVRKRGSTPGRTDQGGRFNMNEISAGTYRFELETKTLPIEFTTMTPTELTVQVPAGKPAMVEFPVVRTGQIKGIVFHDTNRNGSRDAGEPGVSDAVVQVEGSDIISFTDPQGHFTLHGLAPRSWKVAVNVALLGEDTEVTGAGSAEAPVPPNGEVTGVALGIAARERPVVSSFQKSL